MNAPSRALARPDRGDRRRRPAISTGGAGWAAFAALLVAGAPGTALAIGPDEAYASGQRAIGDAAGQVGSIEQVVANAQAGQRSVEARIADGELLLRAKDYGRAAVVFSEILEKYPNHPTAVPDASFLLGETYFASKQYLSARRVFRQVVDRSGDRGYSSYSAKALGRLVDIALRTQDFAALDDVFSKINQLPPSSVESGLQYSRGKGLFMKRDWAGARAALLAVAQGSEHYHQARYLLGLVAIKEAPAPPAPGKGPTPPGASRARYAGAIEAFRQVTQLKADAPAHQHVIDLAWLAIARLYYETDQFLEAADAYNHVDRTSPEFGAALYELAWNYVRLGDIDRASRSLEVLTLVDPNSTNIADGTLLRADLLLRSGQFEKALDVYRAVRGQYDPLRDRVQTFLDSTADPAVYYDKLSKEQLDALDSGAGLPPLAIQWAREAENGPAAFAVIDSANQCRELIKQATAYADKLAALVNAPNRVRAFPELKAGEERAMALLNTITRARGTLAEGLDAVEERELGGEMAKVRAERRALQERLGMLPVSEGDFAQREDAGQGQWNRVSQKLQQLTLQVDTLQATINALRRTIREGPQQGVVRDPTAVKQFESELAQNEHDIQLYRQMIAEIRKQVEAGKVQVGFGDQRYVEDADLRAAFRKAFAEEIRLAAAGAGGKNAIAYAQRVQGLLPQAEQAETRLETAIADIEARVGKKAGELQALLDTERANIAKYQGQLDALDQEARVVVGQVAMRNFGLVRDRLRTLVMRADVGTTEEAWEVRTEQQSRVRNLQRERARVEKQLGDELREVLDDQGEKGAPAGGKP